MLDVQRVNCRSDPATRPPRVDLLMTYFAVLYQNQTTKWNLEESNQRSDGYVDRATCFSSWAVVGLGLDRGVAQPGGRTAADQSGLLLTVRCRPTSITTFPNPRPTTSARSSWSSTGRRPDGSSQVPPDSRCGGLWMSTESRTPKGRRRSMSSATSRTGSRSIAKSIRTETARKNQTARWFNFSGTRWGIDTSTKTAKSTPGSRSRPKKSAGSRRQGPGQPGRLADRYRS